MYTFSLELRAWCEQNRNLCYVPEWLLEEWGIIVDPNFSAVERPNHARSPTQPHVEPAPPRGLQFSSKASSIILGDRNSEHSNGESKDALRVSARQELRSHERILAINSPSKPGCLGIFSDIRRCGKVRWGKGFRMLTSKLTR